MAFSGWDKKLSLDANLREKEQNKTLQSALPVTLVALFIGLGFFSAGMPKLFHWIDFNLNTQGVRDWVIRSFYVLGRKDFFVANFVHINNPYFWEVLDILAVTFETTFILSVFIKRSYFRFYICLAIFFHFFNFLILHIAFLNYLIVYLLFTDWSLFSKKIIPFLKNLFTFKKLVSFIIIYLLFSCFIILGTNSLTTKISPFAFFLGLIFSDPFKIIKLSLLSLAVIVVMYNIWGQFNFKKANLGQYIN